jgi:DMSO/TMAO reductase YedYZ molybdopterin-dependent catalytic subunit
VCHILVLKLMSEQMKNKIAFFQFFITILLGLMLAVPILSVSASMGTDLQVTNLSGAEFNFAFDQILAMPQTSSVAALYCYGNVVTSGNWTGVSLSYLLMQAQMTPEVGSVEFTATDGYHVSIPIDLALQPEIIIAFEKDGQPLSEGLRLVLPGANGAAWIAMIDSITMSTTGADYPAPVGVEGVNQPIEIPPSVNTTQQPPSNEQTWRPTPMTPQNQTIEQATNSPTSTSETNQATPVVQASALQSPLITGALAIFFASLIVSLAIAYVTVRRRRT